MNYVWNGNPNTLAWYAANLEADQAARDFSEAYAAFRDNACRTGTPQDYAMWHAGRYADACDALVRAMPVWEA